MQHSIALSGHNQPPTELETVQSRLVDKESEVRNAIAALCVNPVPERIDTRTVAGEITQRIKDLGNVKKTAENSYTEVKAPYLQCTQHLDAWKRGLVAEIDALISAAKKPLNDFLDREENAERERQMEQARLERVKADALAAAALKHQAAGITDTAIDLMVASQQSEALADRVNANITHARPADLAKSRSKYGATASRKMAWVGRIVNLHGVDLDKLRPYLKPEAIQSAVDAFVRNGGRECGGVKISEEITALNIR